MNSGIKQKPRASTQRQATAPRARRQNPSSLSKMDPYELALTAPFDVRAMGARIPDMYSFPTEVAHITTSYTIHTDNNGQCGAAVLPCPIIGLVTDVGTTMSGGAGGSGTAFGYVSGASTLTATAIKYNPAILPTTLQSRLSDFRVVGHGVRVKPLVSYTNAPGKLHFASVPAGERATPILNGGTSFVAPTSQAVLQSLNIPTGSDGKIVPAIINLPLSGQMSLTELIEAGNLTSCGRIAGPNMFTLKDTGTFVYDTAAAGLTETDFVASYQSSLISGTIAASATTILAATDAYNTSGMTTMILKGIGLPADTDVFEIEVVYHLEGTPTVAVSGTSLSSTTGQVCVDVNRFNTIINRVAQNPAFRLIGSAAMSAMSRTALGRGAMLAGRTALAIMGG